MQVTAWNNGKHHSSGAGYGLKLSAADRDEHFRRSWTSVFIKLPNSIEVEVNTGKASFWGECRELIDKEIGDWLIQSGLAPWPSGSPPKFEMLPDSPRRFVLVDTT